LEPFPKAERKDWLATAAAPPIRRLRRDVRKEAIRAKIGDISVLLIAALQAPVSLLQRIDSNIFYFFYMHLILAYASD
jgi:hypothetical protein